jgi:hypothetical protein
MGELGKAFEDPERHCQLSGPRAPFSGPLGLKGAAS